MGCIQVSVVSCVQMSAGVISLVMFRHVRIWILDLFLRYFLLGEIGISLYIALDRWLVVRSIHYNSVILFYKGTMIIIVHILIGIIASIQTLSGNTFHIGSIYLRKSLRFHLLYLLNSGVLVCIFNLLIVPVFIGFVLGSVLNSISFLVEIVAVVRNIIIAIIVVIRSITIIVIKIVTLVKVGIIIIKVFLYIVIVWNLSFQTFEVRSVGFIWITIEATVEHNKVFY